MARFTGVSALIFAFACGPSAKPAPVPPKAVASAAPAAPSAPAVPDVARPKLQTGPLAPIVHETPLTLELAGRVRDGDYELFELTLPEAGGALGGPEPWGSPDRDTRWSRTVVALDAGAGSFAFAGPVETAEQRDQVYSDDYSRRVEAARKAKRPIPQHDPPRGPISNSVWIRRPVGSAPLAGTLYTPARELPGHVARFVAGAPVAKQDPALKQRWARALIAHFRQRPGAFADFAEQRLERVLLGKKPSELDLKTQRHFAVQEYARLMDTLSGRISVQAALQRDHRLLATTRKSKASIPIQTLSGPRIEHQDWAALGKKLQQPVPEEALARATPAEFYFIRSREVEKLFEIIDELEDWGQPVADWIDGRAQERGTFARYQAELGLSTTGLGKLLGPKIVSEVALVGSDPYLHQGTDVTLIVRPKDAQLWHAALGAMLTAQRLEHGATVRSEFTHEGVTVTVERSKNGRIRRHTASAGGLELVSNSPNGLRRVLSALLGKAPRLADEPDFRYLVARDAGVPEDVLAFAGDRFVMSVVGPAQKIAEARRQLALAELSTPGFSYLLAGTLAGKAPANLAELLASKFLTRADLVHHDGKPIAFDVENGASSSFGTPAALEPLIDLPPVTHVSELEKGGYESFAGAYEREWSEYVDPIALRLRLAEGASGERTLVSDLRVLPLLRGQYRDFTELVGRASITTPPLASGARAVFGIGADASLRSLLNQSGRSFFGSRLRFDWLGDFAGVGVDNKNRILDIVLPAFAATLERPDPDGRLPRATYSEERLAGLPAYAFVAVKSAAAVGLALASLREKVDEVAPGIAQWMPPRPYREASVIEVRLKAGQFKVSIFYALTPTLLVVSPQEESLHAALDRLLSHPPVAATAPAAGAASSPGSAASQLTLELAAEPGSALSVFSAWALNQLAVDAAKESQAVAAAVLRADPPHAGDAARVRRLMKNTFGSIVTTPEGRDYTLGPDGVRDPVRGTVHAPIWPEVPVPGSSAARLLERLRSVRSELSFDAEPPNDPRAPGRSLHARVTFGLGK